MKSLIDTHIGRPVTLVGASLGGLKDENKNKIKNEKPH